MSSEEFVDWQLYYELNPFGPKRGDFQSALIASTIANANAPKGKKFALKDFMLDFKSTRQTQQKRPISSEQVVSFFQALKQGSA